MNQLLKNKKVLFGGAGGIAAIVIALVFSLSSAADLKVNEGDTIVVTVTAPALDDVYGYQFQMHYDQNEFELVSDSLASNISDISMIFSKSFDEYELVGATMIGERPGYTGKKTDVCKMKFVAKQGGMLSEMSLRLNKVNVVKSDLEYVENIEDWSIKGDLAPAA